MHSNAVRYLLWRVEGIFYAFSFLERSFYIRIRSATYLAGISIAPRWDRLSVCGSPYTMADDLRPSSTERGYNSKWRRARLGYLAKHPLCVYCKAQGRLEPATVVDHIQPHRGDKRLFWNSLNWQALCKRCHDSTKQIEEKSDETIAVDASGFPTHSSHAWNDPRWN